MESKNVCKKSRICFRIKKREVVFVTGCARVSGGDRSVLFGAGARSVCALPLVFAMTWRMEAAFVDATCHMRGQWDSDEAWQHWRVACSREANSLALTDAIIALVQGSRVLKVQSVPAHRQCPANDRPVAGQTPVWHSLCIARCTLLDRRTRCFAAAGRACSM